jgi:hypothetical protein
MYLALYRLAQCNDKLDALIISIARNLQNSGQLTGTEMQIEILLIARTLASINST